MSTAIPLWRTGKGFPSESAHRRRAQGQVEGFWKRQEPGAGTLAILNSVRALAGPGQCVKRESCASVESLVGAFASTDSLHDVPKLLFVCSGSSVDVGVFEKDVGVRGFHVEFIKLSGTAVLDLCDDELFRRVKNRITGDEFVAVVLSPPYSTFCRKFRGCTGADVHGLKGLRLDDKEFVRTETLVVFRCIEVLQIIHSVRMPWVLVMPAFPNFVFQSPEMHGVVQPGVLERSLDVGDVLVGRSLVDFVTHGIREICSGVRWRVCFENMAT